MKKTLKFGKRMHKIKKNDKSKDKQCDGNLEIILMQKLHPVNCK